MESCVTSPDFQDLGFGITCIDTGYYRPQLAACYLIIEGDQAAFIDTGTYYTIPNLLEVLTIKGIPPKNVNYVMPTHVHLDHAGGAGRLMSELPNAKLIVHPYGARHLIDPARLIAGTCAVYGEQEFRANFGKLIPVPEDRVINAEDGLQLDLNGRTLQFLDTPGHARHHYCVYDEYSQGIFTGDSFGISYLELMCADRPYIFPTTTPVQFDPEAWMKTLDRLMSLRPDRAFLTHYGMLEGLQPYADELRFGIQRFSEIALSGLTHQITHGPDLHRHIYQALSRYLHSRLAALGCPMEKHQIDKILELDLELNTQGLEVWLDRKARSV